MKSSLRGLLCFLSILLLLTSCRKEEWDNYYGRPEGLADPIYKQLKDRGNFTNLIACIDKSGYKETLNSAGFWTFFAPTDDAFNLFFQENGISGVDAISDSLAAKIVRYSLLYDAYKTDHIGDYLSAKGWVPNQGFRRRTASYDYVYDENVSGQKQKVIASNRNGSYISTDFNNKYISYFTSNYMSNIGLSGTDYNFFFPNSSYTGFNVMNASVTEKDLVAENGVIHIIDKVIVPPKSIDQYIASQDNYSEFKKLLALMTTYSYNADITRNYQVLSGATDNVYVKFYNSALAFSPNNEGYLRADVNDAQNGCYTLFAPTNQALLEYEKNVLLKYYPGKTIEELFALNADIIKDFINAHMWLGAVWPTKFSNSTNYLGEIARFSQSDIMDRKILSNGFFYGSNKVHESDIFSSVYGEAYLNPNYSIMTRALNYYGYNITIKNSALKYNLIMMSDALLRSMGYDYNAYYAAAPVRYNGNADNTLKRILESHIVPNSNNVMDDISGEGIVETFGGEYIKYKNGRLYSSGTYDSTEVSRQSVAVTNINTASNGKVYFANGLLSFTNANPGTHIARFAATATDPYYNFFQYLRSNPIYTASTGAIQSVSLGVNYTILIPTNDAILQAVRDGLLPGTVSGTRVTPTFAPSDANAISQVTKFLQYHIINKNAVVPDGQKSGNYETLLKDANGSTTHVNVINAVKNMRVTDMNGRTVTLVNDNSNVLSNRIVIHQINNYLKYTY